MIEWLAARAILWPLIVGAGTVIGGLGVNYYLGLTDWKTAVIFSAALAAVTFIAQTDKPWKRLAVTAILCAAVYAKATVDKQVELDALKEQHVQEIAGVHAGYKRQSDTELERQARAVQEALLDADRQRADQDAENSRLQALIVELQAAAKGDPLANSDSLSLEAVRRLNRLRAGGLPPGS